MITLIETWLELLLIATLDKNKKNEPYDLDKNQITVTSGCITTLFNIDIMNFNLRLERKKIMDLRKQKKFLDDSLLETLMELFCRNNMRSNGKEAAI